MASATANSIDPIRQALALFLVPGQTCEIRALDVEGRRAVSFVSSDLDRLAEQAAAWDQAGAKGVYFTLNALRPDLSGSVSAKKIDVSRRHWLPIDVDPSRPASTNATEEERQAAWEVADRCRATLDMAGLSGAVVGDSGNGWHTSYPVDLPNDEASQELLKAVLKTLQARCGSEVAQIDTSNHDAPRIWKLYGTTARKGPHSEERPHRPAWIVEGTPWNAETAARNTALLSRWLQLQQAIDDTRKGRPNGAVIGRAKAYIAKEPPAISGQHGHDRCFHVACVLVKDFGLTVDQGLEAIQDWNRTCQPPWSENELRHKLADAAKKEGPVGKMLNGTNGNGTNGNGYTNGQTNGTHRPNEGNSEDPLDRDATAADLIEASCTIRWGWNKWLPVGVLSVLASEPGVGKTRFCADLARRVHLGMPWPDGALPTFEKGSRTLWVPADNQHAELGTLPSLFGFPPESLYLNATRRNPFAGTLLDAEAELKEFEARILRVRPAIVFVDTALNATDRSSHKPEDAKAFFVPLQQIAARTGVVMLCVTHLNAAGKPLGRRIMGQARLVMQLEQPDPEGQPNRRKLHVVKSNSLFPAALGVTMEDQGNNYDEQPPVTPEQAEAQQTKEASEAVKKVSRWLSNLLDSGPKRVHELRKSAEHAGYSTKTLYAAKKHLNVEEFEAEGKKWWKFTTGDAYEE